jgi:ribonuclease VapC
VIIDSSALLAIVLKEPERERYVDAILATPLRMMSVANWFEAAMVLDSRGDPIAAARFQEFIRLAGIALQPVTLRQAEAAREAWRVYGRGRHKAFLNFGDCFAYALARTEREPLLFKGNDFVHTDIEPALKD